MQQHGKQQRGVCCLEVKTRGTTWEIGALMQKAHFHAGGRVARAMVGDYSDQLLCGERWRLEQHIAKKPKAVFVLRRGAS